MDLEQYISNYTGNTKIKRLLFIASNNKDLSRQAATLAIKELKKGINTALYKEVSENFSKQFGTEFSFDSNWASTVDAECQRKLEKLEVELNSYKANMIKESIRMGYNDLGDFFFQRGDYQNALKNYLRTRDYCTTPKHVVAMCLNIIKVSLETGNNALVSQYVSKAEQTMDNDLVVQSKIKVASALAYLDSKKYKNVAKILLEDVDISIENSFSDVISPHDIALYGGLCALATYERSALKSKCLQNSSFKNFLELVPQVRELITDFYESNYTSFLTILDKLLPEMSMDIYLFEHVQSLYNQIRSKALIQYVTPFTSVDLKKMAKVFNTDLESLEKEVAKLIVDKQIKARIDSHNKILHAKLTDQRNNTYQNVMEFGEAYVRETESALLRMNLQKHRDFAVKPTRKSGKNQQMLL